MYVCVFICFCLCLFLCVQIWFCSYKVSFTFIKASVHIFKLVPYTHNRTITNTLSTARLDNSLLVFMCKIFHVVLADTFWICIDTYQWVFKCFDVTVFWCKIGVLLCILLSKDPPKGGLSSSLTRVTIAVLGIFIVAFLASYSTSSAVQRLILLLSQLVNLDSKCLHSPLLFESPNYTTSVV